MSLINDLLCDLEARKATVATAGGFADLRPVRRARVTNRRWLAAPVAGLLLAGSAGAFWYGDSPANRPVTAAVDVPAAAIAETITAVVTPSPPATLLGFSTTLSRLPVRNRHTAPRAAQTVAVASASQAATPVGPEAVVQAQQAPVRQATVTSPDYRAAGLLALGEGRHSDAEKHFGEVVARDPSDTDGWLKLAVALRQQGKSAAAEARLSEALATASTPGMLAQALARDLLGRGADAEALQILKAYRPGTLLDPTHDAFVAAVLQRLGQHNEAAEMYRSVLAVRPETAAWWVGLAISEEALGLANNAAKAYRHARNIGQLDAALARYAKKRIAAIEEHDPMNGDIT